MRGFDKHLHELLKANLEAAREYAKLFAKLPLPTRLAIKHGKRTRLAKEVAKLSSKEERALAKETLAGKTVNRGRL